MIYKIFLLYPYWLLKIIFHALKYYFSSIFFFHVNIKKIDESSGIEFEDIILKLLKKQGYHSIKKTKINSDYGIDLIAKKKHLSYGFQCKRYAKNIGVDAIQQSVAGRDYYHLDEIVVITNSYFTQNAMSLAKVNDVILIDRSKLIKMMKKAKLFSSGIPFFIYLIIRMQMHQQSQTASPPQSHKVHQAYMYRNRVNHIQI